MFSPSPTPTEKAQHDHMVDLVDTMLKLHQKKVASKTVDASLEQQITDTDKAIDALVYQLYDLTPEDIAIVEGSGK